MPLLFIVGPLKLHLVVYVIEVSYSCPLDSLSNQDGSEPGLAKPGTPLNVIKDLGL